MIPEYEVTLTNGTKVRVQAYDAEFHETHVVFKNTTLVKAFRSETVESIERVN